MACATTPSDNEKTFRRYDTRKKRKKISRGAKFGTIVATNTSSAIKAQNKKPTFGVGGG